MHSEFWHARWRDNQIGFHEDSAHPMLARHGWHLGQDAACRVFVPLCGKSLDMVSLRDRGHDVAGVEISPLAVQAFFDEQGIAAHSDRVQGFARWRAPGYELLAGDFFALDQALLGRVGAVYDRAALIALPPDMRSAYADKMRDLLHTGVTILLITLQFDQPDVSTPPFCVRHDEVRALYGDWCSIEPVETSPSEVKGRAVEQSALLLTVR